METPSEAQFVLRHWLGDLADSCGVAPIHAGFSGARVFHVSSPTGEFALRGWSTIGTDVRRVMGLHHFLDDLKTAGLPVARPVPARPFSETVIAEKGRLWHLELWLPGSSVEGERLSQSQLQAAMQVLARMHEVATSHRCSPTAADWFQVRRGPPPAILSRLAILDRWGMAEVRSVRLKLNQLPDSPLVSISLRILDLYSANVEMIRRELSAVVGDQVHLHPCFRDLWSAHVLFTEGNVSGVIDSAAASCEHVAADLSRLLGSWLGDDFARWEWALAYYSQSCPLSPHDRQLIRAYDRSAVLLSGLNWIERLLAGTIQEVQQPAILERMQRIHLRMQGLSAIRG